MITMLWNNIQSAQDMLIYNCPSGWHIFVSVYAIVSVDIWRVSTTILNWRIHHFSVLTPTSLRSSRIRLNSICHSMYFRSDLERH